MSSDLREYLPTLTFGDLRALPIDDDGGLLWDGRAWRFFLAPRSHKKGSPIVSDMSFRLSGDGMIGTYNPLNFVDVTTCLRNLTDGKGETYSIPWQPLSN